MMVNDVIPEIPGGLIGGGGVGGCFNVESIFFSLFWGDELS